MAGTRCCQRSPAHAWDLSPSATTSVLSPACRMSSLNCPVWWRSCVLQGSGLYWQGTWAGVSAMWVCFYGATPAADYGPLRLPGDGLVGARSPLTAPPTPDSDGVLSGMQS